MSPEKPESVVNHEARRRVKSLEQAVKNNDEVVEKLRRSQRVKEGAIQSGAIIAVITSTFAFLAAQFPNYELWHELEALVGTIIGAFGGAVWAGIQHKRKAK